MLDIDDDIRELDVHNDEKSEVYSAIASLIDNAHWQTKEIADALATLGLPAGERLWHTSEDLKQASEMLSVLVLRFQSDSLDQAKQGAGNILGLLVGMTSSAATPTEITAARDGGRGDA